MKSLGLWDQFRGSRYCCLLAMSSATTPTCLSFGDLCVGHLTEENPFFIASLCGWKARSLMWLMFIQTLAVMWTCLTHWDQMRGILFCLSSYTSGKCLLSKDVANRAKDQNNTIHNNNTGVFTTHVNTNTQLTLGTPTGKVTEWKYIPGNLNLKCLQT